MPLHRPRQESSKVPWASAQADPERQPERLALQRTRDQYEGTAATAGMELQADVGILPSYP